MEIYIYSKTEDARVKREGGGEESTATTKAEKLDKVASRPLNCASITLISPNIDACVSLSVAVLIIE